MYERVLLSLNAGLAWPEDALYLSQRSNAFPNFKPPNCTVQLKLANAGGTKVFKGFRGEKSAFKLVRIPQRWCPQYDIVGGLMIRPSALLPQMKSVSLDEPSSEFV